jgi:hypothetical protein
MVCKASGCRGENGKFAERRRFGNDMLEIDVSDVRDSKVPVRLGGDEPLGGVLGTESRAVVVDGETSLLECWLFTDDLLLPGRPLLLAGLGIYLATQLRLF